jgi:hypothetical protein
MAWLPCKDDGEGEEERVGVVQNLNYLLVSIIPVIN